MSVSDNVLPSAAGASEVVAPGIAVRSAPFDAPWSWLGAGWRDLGTVPVLSLSYGAVFALVAFALTWGAMQAEIQSIIPALAGGFLLIGPLVAVGLYEISRRLEAGEAVTAESILRGSLNLRGSLAYFGVALLLAFMVWAQLAFLLFMLFTGSSAVPPVSEFMHTLLFTPRGLGLLVVGTIVGGALAAFVFAISAVSVPLLMVKDVDVVTAAATSVRAVIHNPLPMGLWAALIAGFMVLGILTLFVGLIVAFPLVGHATWHAFRELVVLDEPK